MIIATVNAKLEHMDRGVSEEPAVRLFTCDEAIRMVEAGIVGEDEHFELLEGKLVDSDPVTGDEIIRRFTADEAIRLVGAGIIGEGEHVELLEGAFVEMSPQGPEHAEATATLSERLRSAYADSARVREEKPLAASPFSLPEPDLAIIRGVASRFPRRHPTGEQTVMVVEIASTSQLEDRRKATLYAAGGVSTYWLVDLVARTLEVRTVPVDGAYQVTRVLRESDVVELPESDVRWLIGDLFL